MLTVEVPLNTMLADLDETIRGLLKEQLERHGFEGIEIAFDAPTREWSSQLSHPAVSLFLYDMREAEEHRPSGWTRQRVGDEWVEAPPPLVMEVSYAITAWAQAVEDEHRLLSQVLAVLYAFPELPQAILNGRLKNGSQPASIKTRVGQAKGDKADFWTAVGGQYKASLDYVVLVSCDAGTVLERGPEVRTQRLLLGDSARPRAAMEELYRIGGTVSDGEGTAVANAWVALPDLGMWAATGVGGRFRFDRIEPGTHRCIARTLDGGEASGEVEVPGRGVDLVVSAPQAAKRKS
jgi:hypothetical protein